MEITDVYIRLVTQPTDRLRAFCSVTFDGVFVVRDMRVVNGTNGLFVAMPSRRISSGCPRCRHRNDMGARKCAVCGARLNEEQSREGRTKQYRDIAHPITSEFREKLQEHVIKAYEEARENAASQESSENGPEEHGEQRGREEHGEQADSAVPPSEYDSLIAGLRGGEPDRSEKARAKNTSRGSVGEGREDSRGRGRSPRRGRKPGSEERPAAVSPVEGSTGRPVPKPSGAAAQTSAQEPSFGDGIVADGGESSTAPAETLPAASDSSVSAMPPPEPADQVNLQDAAERPAPSQDSPEDSTAFGAGIL